MDFFTGTWNPDKGLLLVGLIIAVSTVFGLYFSYQNGVSSGMTQERLVSGVDSSNRLAGNTNTVVQDLQNKNAELKRQITYLTKANDVLEASITGGSSSCFLRIIPRQDLGISEVFLVQKGEYPLRELDIELINSIDDTKFERHFSIVKVKKDERYLGHVPFSIANGGTLYSIYISTFNNSWSQQVLCQASGSKKMGLVAYSVYRIYHINRNEKYEYGYEFQEQGCFTCEADLNGVPFVLETWNWKPQVRHLTDFGLIEKSFE